MESRARTKPGNLLKNQIPIRTFADWTERKPGFLSAGYATQRKSEARNQIDQTIRQTKDCVPDGVGVSRYEPGSKKEVEKTISKTQPKTIAFGHHSSREKIDGKMMVASGGFSRD